MMKQHLQYNRINSHVCRNILHRDLLSILNLLNVDDVTFYSRQNNNHIISVHLSRTYAEKYTYE